MFRIAMTPSVSGRFEEWRLAKAERQGARALATRISRLMLSGTRASFFALSKSRNAETDRGENAALCLVRVDADATPTVLVIRRAHTSRFAAA